MYKTVIELDIENPEELLRALGPELDNTEWQRSSYAVEKKEKKIIFTIKAQDTAALRATLNSITQLLSVYEKTKKVSMETSSSYLF